MVGIPPIIMVMNGGWCKWHCYTHIKRDSTSETDDFTSEDGEFDINEPKNGDSYQRNGDLARAIKWSFDPGEQRLGIWSTRT